jgi:hypothetical protein
MTVAELEARLTALEKTVEKLKERVDKGQDSSQPWWIAQAGTFANDPVYDEIVRLGREYRESLRPGRRKKKTPKTNHARS